MAQVWLPLLGSVSSEADLSLPPPTDSSPTAWKGSSYPVLSSTGLDIQVFGWSYIFCSSRDSPIYHIYLNTTSANFPKLKALIEPSSMYRARGIKNGKSFLPALQETHSLDSQLFVLVRDVFLVRVSYWAPCGWFIKKAMTCLNTHFPPPICTSLLLGNIV